MSVHDCPCCECVEDEDAPPSPEELAAAREREERQMAESMTPARTSLEQAGRDAVTAAKQAAGLPPDYVFRELPARRAPAPDGRAGRDGEALVTRLAHALRDAIQYSGNNVHCWYPDPGCLRAESGSTLRRNGVPVPEERHPECVRNEALLREAGQLPEEA
ncbi:MAG TPA: hypothetical protein VFP50_15345 [Anaeromyxobacteraceae bacterium]|nr:hypothetical protein [Anaeromyxobacteraceae bacterium]